MLAESSHREYVESVTRWYWPGRDDLVVDRCFPSEYVWPRIPGFERETDMDTSCLVHCALGFDAAGAVHVHAVRDLDRLQWELKAAGEPLQWTDLPRAAELYDEVYECLRSLGCPVLTWDYQTMGDDVIHEITALARARAKEIT